MDSQPNLAPPHVHLDLAARCLVAVDDLAVEVLFATRYVRKGEKSTAILSVSVGIILVADFFSVVIGAIVPGMLCQGYPAVTDDRWGVSTRLRNDFHNHVFREQRRPAFF